MWKGFDLIPIFSSLTLQLITEISCGMGVSRNVMGWLKINVHIYNYVSRWRVVIISFMKKLVDYIRYTTIVVSYQQFHRSKLKCCNSIHMDQVLYVLRFKSQ